MKKYPRWLTARAAAFLRGLPVLVVLGLAGCVGATPVAECPNAPAPGETAHAGPPWPVALDHASTPETHRSAVDGLLEAMDMEGVLRVALDNSVKMQMEANPKIRQFESVMRKFMAKYLSLAAIREPLTRLYMARFSELELVQLAAFNRTPLGQRTRVELPRLLEEGSKIGLTLVQEHMEELKDLIRAQIEGRGTN
jgi:hypothetical protein